MTMAPVCPPPCAIKCCGEWYALTKPPPVRDWDGQSFAILPNFTRGLPILGRMAIFFLFFAATAGSQTNDWDFNDSHCHLTYNIQVAEQADFSAIRSFVSSLLFPF